MDPLIDLRPTTPDDPGTRLLIDAHLAFTRAVSPEESCHSLGPEQMSGIDLYALEEAGSVVAIGGLKPLNDGTVEVKSVHVSAAARGRGMSRRMMSHLIGIARAAGHGAMVLETGSSRLPAFDAARGLYLSLGFQPCGPIAGYVADPLSDFFRLDL